MSRYSSRRKRQDSRGTPIPTAAFSPRSSTRALDAFKLGRIKIQEENASLRNTQNAAGQLSLLSRPRTTLHNVVPERLNGAATTRAKGTRGFAGVGSSTTLCGGRCRGEMEQGVTLEPSPRRVGFSFSQGGSGAAADGEAWAAATAAAESGVAVNGRRELSLKQLHVRFLKTASPYTSRAALVPPRMPSSQPNTAV